MHVSIYRMINGGDYYCIIAHLIHHAGRLRNEGDQEVDTLDNFFLMKNSPSDPVENHTLGWWMKHFLRFQTTHPREVSEMLKSLEELVVFYWKRQQ